MESRELRMFHRQLAHVGVDLFLGMVAIEGDRIQLAGTRDQSHE